MEAVILAGGRGTRLRPYTINIPKSLLEVDGETILERIIGDLSLSGIKKITIAVNYLSDMIVNYIGDGSRWGIDIVYSKEEKPLGTIGPISLIKNLPENFIVMNGDILTNISYAKMWDYHIERGNDITLAVYRKDVKIDFGIVEFDDEKNLTTFKEKPEYNFNVNMGVYVFNRNVLKIIPENKYYGFDRFLKDAMENNMKIGVYLHKGIWNDIGTLDSYKNLISGGN